MIDERAATPEETTDQKYAGVLNEFAVLLAKMVKREAELEEKLRYEEFAHEYANKQVSDLAQELAVTQSQLEEARKLLKRYEGGGN